MAHPQPSDSPAGVAEPSTGAPPDAPATLVARTWRGATRAEDADAYVTFLHRTGFHEYRSTPGNRGVIGMRRIRGDKAEFLLLTLWDSMEAVGRFAGKEPERAVFYPEDEQFLVERDDHVDHFEVVYQSAPGAA